MNYGLLVLIFKEPFSFKKYVYLNLKKNFSLSIDV